MASVDVDGGCKTFLRAAAGFLVALGEVEAAFLLRPVPNEQIVSVAEAGLLMPAKSTNFQPKPIKGLLMNSLVSF